MSAENTEGAEGTQGTERAGTSGTSGMFSKEREAAAPAGPTPAPAWIRELDMALTVYPQILLTGNVRDVFLLPEEGEGGVVAPAPDGPPTPYSLEEVIESLCRTRGYGALARQSLVDDRVLAWRLTNDPFAFPPALRRMAEEDARAEHERGERERGTGEADPDDADDGDDVEAGIARIREIMIGTVRHTGPAIGLIIPYTARLGSPRGPVAGEAARLLATVEELGHTARPVRGTGGVTPYNTLFWVVEKQEELPLEFAIGSRALRVISVPEPPHDQRRAAGRFVVERLSARRPAADGTAAAPVTRQEQDQATEALTRSSHGMGVGEILAIGRMAADRGLPLARLDEAARLYRVGVLDNPWATQAVRENILNGEAYLNAEVIGQPHAVRRTIEIFMRSAAGLTGAQSSSSPSRPRGTLFLSGPTGVGKTELAKGVAKMILGEDARPIRFDMSEFAEEHARDRLIGAPPGFVGHSAGGELTNAVRAHPMSVLLFDEIDKAHPRLFDLFLQILEDGRLTDGQGATVHFTECVLIFTSNLGVSAEVIRPKNRRGAKAAAGEGGGDGSGDGQGEAGDEKAKQGPRLNRHDKPEDVREALRVAFDTFFNDHIGRPELRNRFGDSFVAMDFIQPESVPPILDKALASVTARIKEVHGADLTVGDDPWEVLRVEATRRLDHGGRGVVTAVESALVNPLSRELFHQPLRPGEHIEVEAVDGEGDAYTVKVRRGT
ncbi:AAA family ATPase [Streptomyces kunmingensis]|uniref:AAA family ATPase n=1 Tax=Streptomyces kunmingensis TaxID=68225 RepID=A0ABU6CKX5_9ACTN|nr:AAA family ATPase [Streptomyces kunmingensis]MEB3964550.1 AAA family ATPase [Streptomyces kunmingensis]